MNHSTYTVHKVLFLHHFCVKQNCFDVQDTSMTCKTPDLSDFLAPSNNSRLSSPELGVVTFGFILDGVEMYKENEDYRMTVYLDPEYFRFEEEGSIKEVQFGERTMITIQVCKDLCKFQVFRYFKQGCG